MHKNDSKDSCCTLKGSSLKLALPFHDLKPIGVEVIAEEGVQLPSYETAGAAGLDLRAFITEPVTLAPGDTKCIPTGIRVAIPLGYEIQIRPRSGMALKYQIIPLNTPGTIDADYRGQIQVILSNLGRQNFTVEPGMRVAQMVLARHEILDWQPVATLSSTERGSRGFGGTGIH